MKAGKRVRKRVRLDEGGVHFVGDVNADLSITFGERGSRTTRRVSSTQRIVQRSGRGRSPEPDDAKGGDGE